MITPQLCSTTMDVMTNVPAHLVAACEAMKALIQTPQRGDTRPRIMLQYHATVAGSGDRNLHQQRRTVAGAMRVAQQLIHLWQLAVQASVEPMAGVDASYFAYVGCCCGLQRCIWYSVPDLHHLFFQLSNATSCTNTLYW